MLSSKSFCGLLVLTAALPALAEDSSSGVSSGARVRLTVASVSGHRLIGTLVRQDEISLDIAHDGSVSSVPLKSIAKLEVSAGRKRRTMAGALCGAALGIGLAVFGSCTGDDCALFRSLAVVVLVPAGAGIGALVGSAIRTERWQTVPTVPPQVAAASPGAKLSFTLRF